MNRMIRMMSGVLLAASAVGCNNDAAIELSGEPTMIQASPQIMLIKQGAEETLLLRLTDEANFSVETGEYTVTDLGPGLTVTHDTTYRLDYLSGELGPNPIQVQHRYVVTADQAISTSFKVSNSGITQEITVIVIPTTLGSVLSSTAPAIGDAITLTLPANLSFTTEGDDASVITVGGDDVVVTEMTSSSVTFVPFPGSSGPVEATGITVAYSPTLDAIDLTSNIELTAVPDIAPVTLSAAAPAIGDPVTVTAGAGTAFSAESEVSFPNSDGSETLEAVIVSQTATTITFLPIPGSTGPVTVTGVTLTPGQGSLLGSFDITSTDEILVPPVNDIPLVFSNPAPAAGEAVTVTAAGIAFHPDLAISFDGDDAFVVSVAADGSSAVILPPIGVVAGVATISNFNLTSLEPVTLVDVPSVNTITTAANYAAASAGGVSLGSAVALSHAVTPTQGAFIAEAGPVTAGPDVDYLGGGNQGGPRYYVLTVATAGSYQIDMGWEDGGGDYDLYVRDAADAAVETSAGSGNPESVTVDLEPGTYYIVFHNWHNSNDSGDLEYVLITVKPVAE